MTSRKHAPLRNVGLNSKYVHIVSVRPLAYCVVRNSGNREHATADNVAEGFGNHKLALCSIRSLDAILPIPGSRQELPHGGCEPSSMALCADLTTP